MDEHAAAWTYGTLHRSELGRKPARVDTCDGARRCGTGVTELVTLGPWDGELSPGTNGRLLGLKARLWDSVDGPGLGFAGVKSAGRRRLVWAKGLLGRLITDDALSCR